MINILSDLLESKLLDPGSVSSFLWHIISETTVKFTDDLIECWGHYIKSAQKKLRASTVQQEAFDEEIHLIKTDH